MKGEHLSNGWPTVSIDSVCRLVRGSSPRPKGDPRYYSGPIPRLMVEDLTRDGRRVTPQIDSLTEEGALLSRPVPAGTIVMVVSGNVGRVAQLTIDACIHDGFVGFLDLRKDVVDEAFFLHCLESLKHLHERNMAGAIWKNITTDQIKEIQFPIPPLLEQRRIAAILDKADAIRRKREVGIRLTDELLRSTFLEMFGDPATNPKKWPMIPFPDVCESRLGKMLDAKKQTGTMKKPYMRNFNVQWGHLDLSSVFEMDFAEDERDDFRLKYGDVLICEGGAGVGQTAIWHDELPECFFQKSLHRVRPKPAKATSQYITSLMWFLMQSGNILGAISSATIPHLTGEKLKTVKVPLPPYSEQVRYETFAYSLASLKLKRKAAASDASDLFYSLVQRAFRGEL